MITRFARSTLLRAATMALACCPLSAAAITMHTATTLTGNQAYSGVGTQFAVNAGQSITLSALGVYDSAADGLHAGTTLTVDLFSGTTVIQQIAFTSASPGVLDPLSQYLFKTIAPLTLSAGTYTLVGYGWNELDPEHNANNGGTGDIFDGGGLITYLSSPFGGGNDAPGTFPTNPFGPDVFSAANMQFAAAASGVPEPISLALLGIGLAAFGLTRKR